MRAHSHSLRSFALFLVLCACGSAQTITEFPVSQAGGPVKITAGPDGNLWFIQATNQDPGIDPIGRMTTAGNDAHFPIERADLQFPHEYPRDIVTGLDGNLWFTQADSDGADAAISRITPQGVLTRFALVPDGGDLFGIAAGPDGNLWVTRLGSIGRITTAGVMTEFRLPASCCNIPFAVAAGPDGNIWFTEEAGNKIGRITTRGVITEFSVPTADSRPGEITAGPDGNVWFVEEAGNKIGNITPAGLITEFPMPTVSSRPRGIAAGPDGNVWFTEEAGNKIGRITISGVVTEFSIPTPLSGPFDITAGPDGNIWFTELFGNKIGRLTLARTPAIDSRILPVVGSTAGVDGSFFRTAVQLHNSTGGPIAGRVVFHPSGLSGSGSDPALPYALSPGQTQSIADLLPAMGRSGLGSADIEATSGSIPAMTVRVFNDAGAAGTAGFTEEPMRAEEALRVGSSGVLLLPADLTRFRFNIGVRSLESGAVVTLTLRDAAGAVVATVSRTFPVTYHQQQSAATLLGVSSLPVGGSISIAVTNGAAIFYGATVDNATGDPSLQIARASP
jgi:virginiamycin B lyase